MGSQASVNTNDKEQQLKKASKMSLIRSLLPIVGLVVIFLLFNFLTDFRMMGNMSLVLSQVYVTMISAMGVFFIMTMGGLDFSQGSILGLHGLLRCGLWHDDVRCCRPVHLLDVFRNPDRASDVLKIQHSIGDYRWYCSRSSNRCD